MPAIIEVDFKGNRREFFLWESDLIPPVRAPVIVEADRGEDLGRVHAIGDHAMHRAHGVPHGPGDALPSRRAKRLATVDDVRKHEELRVQDDDARRKAMERVRANALVMKLTDAEWQWDRKKLTFYFTAEKRVDFRTLVRELASMFRTRIELKQIGVRDEAKRLDGIGRCGRQYCSASWLPELRPVSLGVAKDQRLSLNPTQISGACGRLMCSLRYEHEFYVQSRRRFPKEGKVVQTTIGEERIVSNDIFRERVTLRSSEGEMRTIPLAQFQQETERSPGAPGASGVMTAGAVAMTVVETADVADVADIADVADVAEVADAEDEMPEEEMESAESAELGEEEATPIAARPPSPQQADQRRPHRRRGRRGGRRNRGGRKGPGDAPPAPPGTSA